MKMFAYSRSLSWLLLLPTTTSAWQPPTFAKQRRRTTTTTTTTTTSTTGSRSTTLTRLSSDDNAYYPRGISSPDLMRLSATEKGSSSSSNLSSPPPFMMQAFTACDDTNRPPSLNLLLRSLQQLSYGSSDVRGIFTDHARLGSVASVAHAIGRQTSLEAPPLTPLAAFCFGHGLATLLVQQLGDDKEEITIVLGRDPRTHGTRLADSLARGALSVDSRVRVYYTGIATTPACASFAQSGLADAAVMVTASHLPKDRNGFKVFVGQATTTKQDMMRLVSPLKASLVSL